MSCLNKMPLWSMDDWQYVERQVVIDPKGQAVDCGADGRAGTGR